MSKVYLFSQTLETGIFDEQEEFIQWYGDPARVRVHRRMLSTAMLLRNFILSLSLSLSLSRKENFLTF